MAIFGTGFGISYFPMLKTSRKYFPNKKGLITGIVLCCIGFSTFLFTSLADYIINPEKISPKEEYFEREIAERTRKFILIVIFIIIGLGIIGNCLVFPYTEDEIIPIGTNPENTQDTAATETNNTIGSVYIQKERVKEAIRSKEFYLLGVIAIGNLCKHYI